MVPEKPMKKPPSVCAAERLFSPPERLLLRTKASPVSARKQTAKPTIAENPARFKDRHSMWARQGPGTHGVNTLRDSLVEGRTQTHSAAQLTAFILSLTYFVEVLARQRNPLLQLLPGILAGKDTVRV